MIFVIATQAACVAVPYSVEPTTAETATVVLPSADILVTVGSRKFLEAMEKSITKQDPDIEIVDAVAFRDVAFPAGNWYLNALLTPASCERIQQAMAVDFLLLFGPLEETQGGIRGAHLMHENLGAPLPFGIGRMDAEATLSALVIDLKAGEIVCQVDVSAEGTATIISYVYSLVPYPNTDDSAMDGIAEELVEEIREHTDQSRPRVVLMTAEAAQLWKPIGTGGWTLVEGADAATGEPVYRVFGICGLADDRITLQAAFDRATGFYHDETYVVARDCFQFVADAGGDQPVLASEARRYLDFMFSANLVDKPAAADGPERWEPSGAAGE
jgi:hypothetical protein